MPRLIHIFIAFVVVVGSLAAAAPTAEAKVLLEGKIVRTPAGSLWYVSPRTHQRYWLGRDATAALRAFKATALGVTNASLNKIPISGSTASGDAALRSRLAGYILLQVENKGMLWYVVPATKQRIQLSNVPTLFAAVVRLSLLTPTAQVTAYPTASGYDVPKTPVKPPAPVNGLLYSQRTVTTSRGAFTVDLLTLDRAATNLKVMTDTGQLNDCTNNCTTTSLGAYVARRAGVAGLHGTYFCPPEYASCVGQTGSYLYPVF
ncbi:MAG: hypothetical protein HY976_02950, partial [Candidatus Kerfeldbacteria bacterium]|nr:hypothetical protein [Candidatus Kerfeldbacteria bacterium]